MRFAPKVRGTLLVDAGAQQALIGKKKSLLAIGIQKIEGKFQRGDMVYITSEGQSPFAKGMSGFSSEEITLIRGMKTSEYENRLGYKPADEVIHRDNLVFL